MPIEFACECGKQFKVADEHAGKRSKCPTCGKAVTVPAPSHGSPAPVMETAEDAALRALTDGDDLSLPPRMPGSYSEEPSRAALPGAAPAARPTPAAPPEDSGAAAARALARESAMSKASRRGFGKGKAAQPPKEGFRFRLNRLRIGIGAFVITGGVVWLSLGLSGVLGSVKKFPGIWPSLLIVGGVGTLVSGFVGYVPKSAEPE